jgi:hypothetical protein
LLPQSQQQPVVIVGDTPLIISVPLTEESDSSSLEPGDKRPGVAL